MTLLVTISLFVFATTISLYLRANKYANLLAFATLSSDTAVLVPDGTVRVVGILVLPSLLVTVVIRPGGFGRSVRHAAISYCTRPPARDLVSWCNIFMV